jgi:hypothetical protein
MAATKNPTPDESLSSLPADTGPAPDPAPEDDKLVSIAVEQDGGEIRLSLAGGEPHIYNPRSGRVRVPESHVAEFLATVPGSSLA